MSNILKYQNPSSPLLIQRVNQSGANFVKRLLDPNRKSISDWETKGQKIATHKMSWGEDERGAYVFPEVQEIDGQLVDFSRPPYALGIADYMAHKNNNIIRMSPEEADWFTRNYKQYYPSFKKGGRIHIKKKNRGKFTEYCGGKVTEECIARGKSSKNPLTRKRANFASVVRKWKHENGGILKAQEGTGNLLTPHPLSPIGIALNQAKAMAKGKKDQQHLPPGVKEVVGPDGKKVTIRTEQPLVPLEQGLAEWLPGTGDVAEVGYIANDVKNGNYGTAALATAMVALPGNIGKIFRKSDIPTSKLTEAERLGIPKGERNQPAKAPTKSQTYKKTANLESDKDYLEDIEAIQQGFLGKTFLDSEHETLLDWFNSPQYKERLVKQGFSEEQINNLLSNIKDKLSRKNLKYAVDLNSIREWGIGSGGALKIDPQLYPAYEAMTNGNIKIGGQPINWSLIQLKKGVNLDEMIPHEVGGHHLESLVAEFNAPYTSQQITDMGKKAAISSGLPEGYYPSWWETRARALTIAKQMKEAGWNPNSPEQVNVWLNKHLLKDHNTNVVQGALYYDRPGFVKAVSEGLKNGGKL